MDKIKESAIEERTAVFLPDGTLTALYNDDIIDHGTKLNVTRVTDVEFDNKTQKWVARLIKTGEIIATSDKRETVLKEEARIVQEMLFEGKDIKPNETQN